jgi:hypothetical protein
MNNQFTYNILRYQHSQLSGESVNVGLLFSFEGGPGYHFVTGNLQRAKALFPEFDSVLFQAIVEDISEKISFKPRNELFGETILHKEPFINILLPEDSSALQFSDAFTAINRSGNLEKTMEQITRLLLPDWEPKKEDLRHNEHFILKKFADAISKRNVIIEHRMRRNQLIQIKGVKLNFELAWKNGTVHLVKPVSFDLKEDRDIQNKSATYFGYLNLLTDYAKRNDYQFDLLIAKPQDERFQGSYEDALYNLDQSPAPRTLSLRKYLKIIAKRRPSTSRPKIFSRTILLYLALP